ncbi:MAG: amidohydrolase [Dehalococcoidia bacterium]|nr:amidohydrolase [Dehalococcoidia bacterium]
MPALVIHSSDSHLIEEPTLWSTRIEKPFAGREPRMIAEPTGDWFYADGIRLQSPVGGTLAGIRFKDQDKLTQETRWTEVVPGAYQPAAKLKDMDADGIYGEVIYPTLGMHIFRLPDPRLIEACFRAYNDHMAEFCSAAPKRLKGVALICLDDIPTAVRELERAAKNGFTSAMIAVYQSEEDCYEKPRYDPFWAAAQDLSMPLALHIGTNRTAPRATSDKRGDPSLMLKVLTNPSSYVTAVHWVQLSIADMVFSSVFERFPKLQVVSLEHEGGWAPYFIEQMDYTYTQRGRKANWVRFKGSTRPSDFFRRSVSISIQEDAFAIKSRDIIGVDNLLWGDDYPHAESTYPHTQEILAKMFAGVPESDKAKILGANTRRLYRFS